MLKQIRVKNFVHFEEETTLSFDPPGPYFFIGENGSGKSCTLEALRRCLSTSKNLLVSTSHRPDSESIVLCKFLKSEDDVAIIYSGYVRMLNGEANRTVDVKFVCEIRNEKIEELSVDLTKANTDGLVTNVEVDITETNFQHNLERLLSKPDAKLEDLITCVRDEITTLQKFKTFQTNIPTSEQNGYTNTKCDYYLIKNIDEFVVITDPMRSIGCVEWTNSERLTTEQHIQKGKKLLEDMQTKCEILRWYFKHKDEFGHDERRLVRSYFDTLTDMIPLNFFYEGDKIVVRDNETNVSLEKVPEGIFEAKICAILLAIKAFKTVCLDEPGRGMHPQMAERMKDLILRKIKNKTVIVTSHSPSFLSSWTLSQTYFFQAEYGKTEKRVLKFKTLSGKSILESDEQKTPRLITSQHFPSLFFARRLFVVEGDSEYLFLMAIKSILLEDDQLLTDLTKKVGTKTEKEVLLRFLSSLHILPLNGEPNKIRIERICKKMSKERYFMLDFDAILQDKKNPEDTERFFADFKLDHAQFKKKEMPYLEEKGIFVFRRLKVEPEREVEDKKMAGTSEGAREAFTKGTIEDAFISFTIAFDKQVRATSEQKLEDFFNNQNLKLKWNNKSQNNKKGKLFNDVNMTDENIHKVVEKVLTICAKRDRVIDETELFRMVKFLLTRVDVDR